MGILNKPYELSVWSDQWNNDQSKFIETRVCTIGAHDMISQSRALNPKLVKNVNGSNTFSFTIYYRYKDNITGEEVTNPFAQYLANERKLKLNYDNEWYDFVIKSVKIDSTKYTYDITATDQYINELSKNGFNKTFDAELNNNVGSVQALTQRTLGDTDWEVPDVGEHHSNGKTYRSEFIPDIAKEALVRLNVDVAFNATRLMETDGQRPAEQTGANIAAESIIYAFYSCCKDKTNRFQFIYLNGATPTKDDERVITNKNCQYYIDDCDYSDDSMWGIGCPTNCSIDGISNEYRGGRYVFSPDTTYNSTLDTYVTTYKKDDVDYYGFQKTKYEAPILLKNFATNGDTFKSTAGWSTGVKEYRQDQDDRGDIKTDFIRYNTTDGQLHHLMEDIKTSTLDLDDLSYTPILHYTCPNSRSILVNTGPYDNRLTIGNLVSGEKYIINLKLAVGSASISNVTLRCGYYPYDATKHQYTLSGDEVKEYFQTTITCAGNGGITKAVTIEQTHCTENEFKRQANGKIVLIFENLPTDVYIEKFEFYKAIPKANISDPSDFKYMRLDDQLTQAKVTTTQYFYLASEINGAKPNDTAKDFKPITYIVGSEDADIANFKATLSCEKRRALTIKESNYFNIIQTLCESFECWAEFLYDRNIEGAITKKRVVFHNYIGQENYAGFRYGVNLKSVSRTDDSKQIVTKLIVKQNSNEFGKNGFCTIARAPSNETGESYIFNFDYYIKQGLLTPNSVNTRLYKGYYIDLRQYNNQLQTLSDNLVNRAIILAQAQANLTLYENALQAAKDALDDASDSFKKFIGSEWTLVSTLDDESKTKLNDSKNTKYLTDCLEQDQAIRKYTQLAAEAKTNVTNLENEYTRLESDFNELKARKENLLKQLYAEFSNYIQEGTWQSEDYYDDEKYYLDAQSTLYNSCVPKVSYSMSVLELSQLNGYEPFNFKLGDRTFVEDPEFFGYDDNGAPVREQVVLTEITYNLDQPEKNSIKIQNYKTQFQDLFKKITATVQSVQYSTGAYQKAAELAAANDSKKAQYLQGALMDAGMILENLAEQTVRLDASGLTITDGLETNKALRAVSGGILLTEDGGNTWKTGITAKGVSASVLTSGVLNTGEVNIMYGPEPSFRWDSFGITAYNFTTDGSTVANIDPTTGVRFDRLGIYGFTGAPGDWHPNNIVTWNLSPDEQGHYIYPPTASGGIRQHSIFELTKEGLYLDLGKGRKNYHVARYYDPSAQTNKYTYRRTLVEHETYAELGKVEDVAYNKWNYSDPYYVADGTAAFVKVMAVGNWTGTGALRKAQENFVLYDDGTVRAKKIFVTDGISFDHGGGLIKWAWHRDTGSISKPTDPWSSLLDDSPNTWHKIEHELDIWRSMTADGGLTWTNPEFIRRTDLDLDINGDTQFFYDKNGLLRTSTLSFSATSGFDRYQWLCDARGGGLNILQDGESPNLTLSQQDLVGILPNNEIDAPNKVGIYCEAWKDGKYYTDNKYIYKTLDGIGSWGYYCTNPHLTFNAYDIHHAKTGYESIEFHISKGDDIYSYLPNTPTSENPAPYNGYTIALSSSQDNCLSFSINNGVISVQVTDEADLPQTAHITATITPYHHGESIAARTPWTEDIAWSFALDGEKGDPLYSLSLSEPTITMGVGPNWSPDSENPVQCNVVTEVKARYGGLTLSSIDFSNNAQMPEGNEEYYITVKSIGVDFEHNDIEHPEYYAVTGFSQEPSYLEFTLYKRGILGSLTSTTLMCYPNRQGEPGVEWDIEFQETGNNINQLSDDTYSNLDYIKAIAYKSKVEIENENEVKRNTPYAVYWKLQNTNLNGSNDSAQDNNSTICYFKPVHISNRYVWQYSFNNTDWLYVGGSNSSEWINVIPGKIQVTAYTGPDRDATSFFDYDWININPHAENGTSPWSLSLNPDNFVIGTGSTPTIYDISFPTDKSFTVSAYHGNNKVNINDCGTDDPAANSTQVYLKYAVSNLKYGDTVATMSINETSGDATSTINKFQPWDNHLVYQDTCIDLILYDGVNAVASARFSVIPNTSGAPGESWDIKFPKGDTFVLDVDASGDTIYPENIISARARIQKAGSGSSSCNVYWQLVKDNSIYPLGSISNECCQLKIENGKLVYALGAAIPTSEEWNDITVDGVAADAGSYVLQGFNDSNREDEFDSETIKILPHANNGAPGTSPWDLSLNPDNFVIGVGNSGIAESSISINRSIQITAYEGGTQRSITSDGEITVTTSATNVVVDTNGITYSDAGIMILPITSFSPWQTADILRDCYVTLTLKKNNVTVTTATFKVIPNREGAPGESWDIEFPHGDTFVLDVDASGRIIYPTNSIVARAQIQKTGSSAYGQLVYWQLSNGTISQIIGEDANEYCSIKINNDGVIKCETGNYPNGQSYTGVGTMQALAGSYTLTGFKTRSGTSPNYSYSDEFDSETIKIMPYPKNGTSPYKIDILNDFDSVPTTAGGAVINNYPWRNETTHTITAWSGTSQIEFVLSNARPVAGSQVPDYTLVYTNHSCSHIYYNASDDPSEDREITSGISGNSISGTTIDIHINGFSGNADTASIIYELFKGTTKVASGKFEASKNKQGESAVDHKIQCNNGDLIKYNPNTNSYSNNPLSFTAIEITGDSQAPFENARWILSCPDQLSLQVDATDCYVHYIQNGQSWGWYLSDSDSTPASQNILVGEGVTLELRDLNDNFFESETLSLISDGINGTGTDATNYYITANAAALDRNAVGNFSQDSIALSAWSKTGDNNPVPVSVIWKYALDDSSTYIQIGDSATSVATLTEEDHYQNATTQIVIRIYSSSSSDSIYLAQLIIPIGIIMPKCLAEWNGKETAIGNNYICTFEGAFGQFLNPDENKGFYGVALGTVTNSNNPNDTFKGIIGYNSTQSGDSYSTEETFRIRSTDGQAIFRKGQIAGWNIEPEMISKNTIATLSDGISTAVGMYSGTGKDQNNNWITGYYKGTSSNESPVRFFAGQYTGNTFTPANCPFVVTANGALYATSGSIGGCNIVNGSLQVPVAHITGAITAEKIEVKNGSNTLFLADSSSSPNVRIAGFAINDANTNQGSALYVPYEAGSRLLNYSLGSGTSDNPYIPASAAIYLGTRSLYYATGSKYYQIAGQTANDTNDFRFVIGPNFGVKADGSLYANNGIFGGRIIAEDLATSNPNGMSLNIFHLASVGGAVSAYTNSIQFIATNLTFSEQDQTVTILGVVKSDGSNTDMILPVITDNFTLTYDYSTQSGGSFLNSGSRTVQFLKGASYKYLKTNTSVFFSTTVSVRITNGTVYGVKWTDLKMSGYSCKNHWLTRTNVQGISRPNGISCDNTLFPIGSNRTLGTSNLKWSNVYTEQINGVKYVSGSFSPSGSSWGSHTYRSNVTISGLSSITGAVLTPVCPKNNNNQGGWGWISIDKFNGTQLYYTAFRNGDNDTPTTIYYIAWGT